MVNHIVCYKLKDNSKESKEKAKETLLSMQGKIDCLMGIEVGLNQTESGRSYDMVLVTTFLNFDDLNTYQNNKYHCEVVKPYMHEAITSSVLVDYEY